MAGIAVMAVAVAPAQALSEAAILERFEMVKIRSGSENQQMLDLAWSRSELRDVLEQTFSNDETFSAVMLDDTEFRQFETHLVQALGDALLANMTPEELVQNLSKTVLSDDLVEDIEQVLPEDATDEREALADAALRADQIVDDTQTEPPQDTVTDATPPQDTVTDATPPQQETTVGAPSVTVRVVPLPAERDATQFLLEQQLVLTSMFLRGHLDYLSLATWERDNGLRAMMLVLSRDEILGEWIRSIVPSVVPYFSGNTGS
jgi:hypothetical protein